MAGSAQGAVDSLLGRLSSVLLEEAKLLRGVRADVEFIKDEMMNMNGFLLDLAAGEEREQPPNHQVAAWAKQVKELAYDSQNCIDRYVQCLGPGARRAPRLLRSLLARHRIAVRIRELKARARDLGERRLRYDVRVQQASTAAPGTGRAHPPAARQDDDARSRALLLASATDFLGDDVREVISWLTKELPEEHPQRRLRVVAVVRRQYHEDEYPLAREVYKHPSVSRCFNLTASINGIETKYNKRQAALLCVLKQLPDAAPPSDDMDEKRLAEKLRDHLSGKRFLIVAANDPYRSVLAAVQSACTNLPAADSSFPPGSAILVTTWLQPPSEGPVAPYQVMTKYLGTANHFCDTAVALVGDGCDTGIQEILIRKILMRRGWNFFCMELFLRALYVNPNRSREELQSLLNRLTPPTIAPQIMEYCYNDLPSHYKGCLLYLSNLFKSTNEETGSAEDFKVKRRTTIVRLWAAQNFIGKRDELGAIDEAERCFNELLLRGLVRPVDVGAAGKVKTCTVHHRFLKFITDIAGKEGLLHVGSELPPDLACRQQIQPLNEKKTKKKNKYQKDAQQSTTCWKLPTPMDSSECAVQVDHTKALLESPSPPKSSWLRRVQVLDLEGFQGLTSRDLRDICNMIQLKYLSIRNTDVTELPKDIEKLRYLETLDIRQTKIRTFTTKAIVLPKLMHLLAGFVEHQGCHVGRSLLSTTVHMPRGIGSMTDLQILCHIVVSNSADELIEVGRLQQLRKLGLVLRGKEVRLNHFLRVVERLNESLRSLSVKIEINSSKTPDLSTGKMAFSPPRLLESLNINGCITGLPIWIKDLRQLVKVTLRGTSLMENAIRMLGELVSLRCLRLWHASYIETRLAIKDGEFQNLKYLVVEVPEVTNIHFRNGAAPKIEKIVWASSKMETISGIKDLPCLKEIELHGDCQLPSIIKDMEENKNHPVVIHKANYEALN